MEILEQQPAQVMESKTKTFIYDGSFNGFLTAVYIGFEQKIAHAEIQASAHAQNGLFAETETTFTDIEKAKRVWNGIKNRSNTAIKHIYFAFLSEHKGIESLLYCYIQKFMGGKQSGIFGFSDDCILKINQFAHKVAREKQRIEAFVQFQLTKDGINFAQIEPDFDVLPLISKHFRSLYSERPWIIYDVKRNYGLYYDLIGVELIRLDLHDILSNGTRQKGVFTREEFGCQNLWSNYFQRMDIKSYIHKKLDAQPVTTRYGRYFSEEKEAV